MTINAPFMRWVADQAPAVSLPKAHETRANDPAEYNLKSTFEFTADFGQKIGALTKDLVTTDAEPPAELKPELEKLTGEFEAYGKKHSDSAELTQQILGDTRESGSLFPSKVIEGPNGTFAVVLNRTSEPGYKGPIIPEKGFFQEPRGVLFVDPTPGADGVITCFQDLKPEPRAEFAALCGPNAKDIRFVDAGPENPFKAEVGGYLKEMVELTSIGAQNPDDKEAEARAQALQEKLKPYEKFFGDFLAGDTGRGVPMAFEDRGNGIYALQLKEVSGSGQVGGPCGYIYLDTRPGLPGFNAFTQLS